METFDKKKEGAGARIAPLPMSEMREDWLQILKKLPGAGLKGKNSPINVFGTLMYSPAIFGPFLDYWVTSKLKMSLSVREQELVILRMGFHYSCEYVWKHHVPVALEFGATGAEIETIQNHEIPPVFSARESALLMLTDEMTRHRTIRDEAWSEWSPELSRQDIIDLIYLVSQYVFFSLLNNSIRVEIEEPLR